MHPRRLGRLILGVTPVRKYRRQGWVKEKPTCPVVATEASARLRGAVELGRSFRLVPNNRKGPIVCILTTAGH